jgi:hypothetical protein
MRLVTFCHNYLLNFYGSTLFSFEFSWQQFKGHVRTVSLVSFASGNFGARAVEYPPDQDLEPPLFRSKFPYREMALKMVHGKLSISTHSVCKRD